MIKRKITLQNPSGLHMRPAGVFVKVIKNFDSDVMIFIRENKYNAKSMLNLLSACVKYQDEIELIVSGKDEIECMEAAVMAIESGLGE